MIVVAGDVLHGASEIRWTSIGPGGGGFIPAIVVVPPIGGRPKMIYAGCNVGGFYKSTDEGQTWRIFNNGFKNYDVEAIVYDPRNPDIIYVATTDGVYKTIDGGMNWLGKRNGFPSISDFSFTSPVSALTMDPSDANVLYAGTGLWSEVTPTESYGKGQIYKTTNGGENWAPANTGPNVINSSATITQLAIDPGDTRTLYAATNYGLYKSTDSGLNWVAKNDGLPDYQARSYPYVYGVTLDSANPHVLYCTLYSKPNDTNWNGGVYKSTDAGESWVWKSSGLVPPASEKNQYSPSQSDLLTRNYHYVCINPSNPDVLYTHCVAWWGAGVWKSTDGAGTWTLMMSHSNIDDYPSGRWSSGGIPAPVSLALDSTDPDTVYTGDSMNIYKTIDGGGYWRVTMTERVPQDAFGEYYWKSTGLETTTADVIAADPRDANRMYFGYHDIGFLKTLDGGASFKISNANVYSSGGDNVFALAIDTQNPNVIYASFNKWKSNTGKIVKSSNYGENWTLIGSTSNGLPDGRIYTLLIDPSSPADSRTIYAGSYAGSKGSGVYKTVDGGQNWTACNNGLGAGENQSQRVMHLSMAPSDPRVIYASVEYVRNSGSNPSDLGGVYKSTDSGNSWTKIGISSIASASQVAIDPVDPNTIYVGAKWAYDPGYSSNKYLGGVYKSTDSGNTWSKMLDYTTVDANRSAFHISALCLNPADHRIIYATTYDSPSHDQYVQTGVMRSRDAGQSWEIINEGLSNHSIKGLAVSFVNPAILYAATSGNGVFRGIDYDADIITPGGMIAETIGAHRIGLSWNRNDSVRFRLDVSTGGTTRSLDLAASSCTLTRLRPATTYYFALTGFNAFDVPGLSSATLAAATLPVPWGVIGTGEKGESVLAKSGREIRVEVLSGAVTEAAYVEINDDPLNSPIRSDSEKIRAANLKLANDANKKIMSDSIVEFVLMTYDTGEAMEATFDDTVSISLPYADEDNDGFVDGTSPKVSGKTLKVYGLNEAANEWELAGTGGTVDETDKRVSANVSHFSVYALIGVRASSSVTDLRGAIVYPNPYREASGSGGIIFDNLTPRALIRIYNVAGEMVRECNKDGGGTSYKWDATNDDRRKVASGIYIYFISNPDDPRDKASGKLAIVR